MTTPVTVIYGNKRKLVNIDKRSLVNTRGEIKRKFSQLGDGFILQAKSEGEHFDIEDEDDFADHPQAATFVVRDASEIDQPVNPRPQPTPRGNTARSVNVIFGKKKKLITFDMSSLQTTRANIHRKFNDLSDDFQLLAESGDARDQYDIDDDDDLMNHADARLFHIQVARGCDEACRSRGHSQSEATVICNGECKLVGIDDTSLQKTRNIISAKFKIVDFRLYAVSPDGIQYEVEDEQEWLKYRNFRTFIIKSNYASLRPQSMEFDFHSTHGTSLPPPYSLTQIVPSTRQELSVGTGSTAVKSLVRQFNDRLQVQACQTTSLTSNPQPQLSLLDNLPGPDTPIVKDAILELRDDIDIPGIHSKMEVFGDCLRLALYGVIAAAKSSATLETQVQELQFNALKLCKESDLTIVHCKQASGEILNLLASAFVYLSDDLVQAAQKKLERIGELSKEMQVRSKTIKDKLVLSTDVVQKVITATTTEREGVSKPQESLKADKSKRKDVRDVHTFPGAKLSGFSKLVSFFTMNKTTTTTNEPNEAQIQERINRHITEENYENDQMLSMAERLKADGDVATALHGTLTALKSLHSSFETAEKFWSNIHMLCERVAGSHSNMHSTGQEQPINYWKSKGFQEEAYRTYASFMALHTLCHDFHAGMGLIEDNIQYCMQDNPTPEQAKSKLKDIAETFQKKIEKKRQSANQQLTNFVAARELEYRRQENQELSMGTAEVPRPVEDVPPATTHEEMSLAPT